MRAVSSVVLALVDAWGHERGRVTIATLPREKNEYALCLTDDPSGKSEAEQVQLLEGTEYLYTLDAFNGDGCFDSDHPEMFFADTARGDRGRLRTGVYTGLVEVWFFLASQVLGQTCFEVRSTKLSYLTDYQWMMRDIAEISADLVMDRFAPAEARFSADDQQDSETLYQRFAFLRSALESDEFHSAMQQILTSPHVTWDELEDVTAHGCSVRPSSRITRSLARPGPRVPWPNDFPAQVESVPHRLTVFRSVTSVDNEPNRFVKWLLREWLGLVLRVSLTLDKQVDSSGRQRRGRKEVVLATQTLEHLLEEDLFRHVGELERFPEANQVLQKREAYRTLFRLHLQLEVAARLYWPGLDPVYRAGQRHVAKLYEYWVYLQFGRLLARLSGRSFDAAHVIEKRHDGLTLHLRTGESTKLTGTIERLGRTLRLESWFNKSFGATAPLLEGSWTRPLRPDISLRIEVSSNGSVPLVTWIHFDAKYRIERLTDVFGGAHDTESYEAERTQHRREDLLKMHAYKDGITRSAGAYIIYPGNDTSISYRQYHELLPGLGAFALRPSNFGESLGSDALSVFLEHVFTHLAMQATQDARVRYWTERAHADMFVDAVLPAAPFLTEPPADVPVLLGLAKNAEHRAWIRRTRTYNLRADTGRGGAVGIHGRELTARFLIVYGPDAPTVDLYEMTEAPRVMTAEQLLALAYPEPRGHLYLCLSLRIISSDDSLAWLTRVVIDRVRARKNPDTLEGAPMLVTWLDVCAEVPSWRAEPAGAREGA